MQTTFRFIIIGGGSAGCLLARTLAEHNVGSVLLLESGGPSGDVRTRVPNYYPRLFGSRYDWGYQTETCAELAGRSIHWPRGRMVGGSGAMNALIYLQSAREDFERWGWDWAESWDWEELMTESAPLPVEPLRSLHAWSQAFLESCAEGGSERLDCLSIAAANTCGPFGLTQSGGRRRHTGDLLSELPSNLTVLANFHVTHIELHASRAVAVCGRDGSGKALRFTAESDIVLSAGVIGSPQILIQSGIGPATYLESLGIPCHSDLPGVGQNLQDHLVYPIIFETKSQDGLPRRHNVSDRNIYRREGTGGLASNIAEAGCFGSVGNMETSDASTAPQTTLDCQIHFTPTHYLKYPISPTLANHFSIGVTDLHPRSRGELRWERLPNSETISGGFENQVAVQIDPGYLRHASDLDRLVAAVEWGREIAARPPLAKLIAREIMPGPKRIGAAAIGKSIRMFAQSIYHPVGTCRMECDYLNAADEAKTLTPSVVDRNFRVHGIDGLRIADASILPDLPSANTNAVTLLLAARAATLLNPNE